jgi:hypothetical protein
VSAQKEIRLINGFGRFTARPAGRQSTLIALGLALAAAIAGAVLWGLVATMFHRQLSLFGLLIGAGVGLAVSRHRAGHLPTIVAGAAIAVVGCALGTLLAIVFSLLHAQVSMSTIVAHFGQVMHGYPSAVGVLGLVFWLIAAVAAVRIPIQARPTSPQTQ